MRTLLQDKAIKLLVVLAGFLVTNALVAEFIGVKIFSLEPSLGLKPLAFPLFGQKGSFDLTAGVLLWPVVFIMTDLLNEYFGKKAVRFLSWLTAALIAYGFLMIFGAIELEPAGWWIKSAENRGIVDRQAAYANVLGQGLWIIGGSLLAFLVGQVVDAAVFHRLRIFTGGSKLWLRATGSTLVSQFIDSYVVLYVAFVLNPNEGWPMDLFLAVGTRNYLFKFVVALLMTPVIYWIHTLIDRYLGAVLSSQLRQEASGESSS